MPDTPTRYESEDEDSARWLDFPIRQGDIVISTRSKSGTTWMQMICALLVFQTAELPARLAELSPWLDWLTIPQDQVYAELAAQSHRRFIKTHTPLDGIPLDQRATYIVVARHPLDMAVSLYHQGQNIDRRRLREIVGHPDPTGPIPPTPPLVEWLRAWIDNDAPVRRQMDSVRGVMWHLSDAWARQGSGRPGQPDVVLAHYDDLSADLEGQMRRLAGLLGVTVPEDTWPQLVKAATFDQMRARADEVLPDRNGILKDSAAFFRRGTSGSAREVLTPDELAHYQARVAEMAPPDLLKWLHRDEGRHS